MAQWSIVGHCFLIVNAPRLCSDTLHSVGLLWTRDQLDAETTHNTHKRQTCMSPAGFEPSIFIRRSHLRLLVFKVKCTIVQALRLCTGHTAHRRVEV